MESMDQRTNDLEEHIDEQREYMLDQHPDQRLGGRIDMLVAGFVDVEEERHGVGTAAGRWRRLLLHAGGGGGGGGGYKRGGHNSVGIAHGCSGRCFWVSERG